MHKQYGQNGLVAVSVNLDDPEDKKVMTNVQEFLDEQKVSFRSYILNETQEEWQRRLDLAGPPLVIVFGRDGKVARRFEGVVDYESVKKLALDLMGN